MTFTIEIEREDDGRWLAEVPASSGVMAYGQDRDEAVARVQALALRLIAERLEHREAPAEFVNVTFQAAWATGHQSQPRPRCSPENRLEDQTPNRLPSNA